jgi:hypothetical protein
MTEPTPEPTAADLWQLKPWWCQPWSILLTGLVAVAGSWLLLQRWWITAPLAVAVLLWWWLFLVLVPAAYRAERQPPGPGPLE